MRLLAVYILIFTVLLSTFNKAGILLGFKLNQSKIIQTLCENRDKPALHCDGKCYLKKQINASEKNEAESPVYPKYVEINFIIPQDNPFVLLSEYLSLSQLPPYLMVDLPSFYFDIFHPPAVS